MQTINALAKDKSEQAQGVAATQDTQAEAGARPATAVRRTPGALHKLEWDRIATRLGAVVFAVLLWHLASSYGFNLIINFENIPTPVVVWNEFLSLIHI